MNEFRQPAVAGLFYPAGYWKLKEELKQLFDSVSPSNSFKNLFGLVAPHAGYPYSGRTAAMGYSLLKERQIENVFIISPSHKEYFPGVSVYAGLGYETPIGKVTSNLEIIDEITRENKVIYKGIEGHRGEHGIEVHLPFLQYLFGDTFKIIPIVMGDQSKIFVDELSRRISRVIDKKSIVIASSDLSHYYNRKEAEKRDSIIEKRINNFDYKSLQVDFESNTCEACGAGPIIAAMQTAALVNTNNSMVIHRCDSGEVTGDLKEVVGYLSAVIYGE